MNALNIRLSVLRDRLARSAAERADRREFERQILAYSSAADRLELEAALARHSYEDGAGIRRILQSTAA